MLTDKIRCTCTAIHRAAEAPGQTECSLMECDATQSDTKVWGNLLLASSGTYPEHNMQRCSGASSPLLSSVINQLDAQHFFTISLYHASTCFEHHVLIIRRSKLHYTASGIITPIGVTTIYLQLNRGSFESKHNYLMLLSLFQLTTCFGLCTRPSSGHKIYIYIIEAHNYD